MSIPRHLRNSNSCLYMDMPTSITLFLLRSLFRTNSLLKLYRTINIYPFLVFLSHSPLTSADNVSLNVEDLNNGYSAGSKGGAPGAPPPPPRTKMFLISCSFGENPANLYVGTPSYGESCIRPWGTK